MGKGANTARAMIFRRPPPAGRMQQMMSLHAPTISSSLQYFDIVFITYIARLVKGFLDVSGRVAGRQHMLGNEPAASAVKFGKYYEDDARSISKRCLTSFLLM